MPYKTRLIPFAILVAIAAAAHLTLSTLFVLWSVAMSGRIVRRRDVSRALVVLSGLAGLLIAPAAFVHAVTGSVITGRALHAVAWLWPAASAVMLTQAVYATARGYVARPLGAIIILYDALVTGLAIVRYALLLGGAPAEPLVALSAAGFKVSQLVIVFSALGVGIGFGLQGVVNNFVSGLILMFERPIQPGDVIDVAGISGSVREIGMRATTIRRFDGADVIVPNGMLVAERVTNWTLRDRIARIEIAVGVAYGSDVDRVAALLEQAVQQTPRIAGHPPPVVLFRELGPSSLDFVVRAWTGFDDQQAVRSALLGRIYQALVDAGIEIPFPQQDLHLRGLPDGLADALSRRAAAGDPAAGTPPSAAPPADGGHGGTDRRAPDR